LILSDFNWFFGFFNLLFFSNVWRVFKKTPRGYNAKRVWFNNGFGADGGRIDKGN
jgi:hypothetical protein